MLKAFVLQLPVDMKFNPGHFFKERSCGLKCMISFAFHHPWRCTVSAPAHISAQDYVRTEMLDEYCLSHYETFLVSIAVP